MVSAAPSERCQRKAAKRRSSAPIVVSAVGTVAVILANFIGSTSLRMIT